MRLRARWRWIRLQYGYMPLMCSIIIMACMVATIRRNHVWGSNASLYEDTAMKSPEKVRVLINTGMALKEIGDVGGAEMYFQRAIAAPVGAHHDQILRSIGESDLAYIYIERGEYGKAELLLRDALKTPTGETLNAGALLELIGGNPDAAIQMTDDILANDGAFRLRPSLWATRGQAFQMLGRCDEAEAAYVTIKSLQPDFNIPHCP